MRLASYVFWSVCVIDMVVFLSVLVVALQDQSGLRDGGREIGLLFFVLAPALLLGGAMLLFHFTASRPHRLVAALIAPAVWLAQALMDGLSTVAPQAKAMLPTPFSAHRLFPRSHSTKTEPRIALRGSAEDFRARCDAVDIPTPLKTIFMQITSPRKRAAGRLAAAVALMLASIGASSAADATRGIEQALATALQDKRGITLYVVGQSIAGAVIRIEPDQWVELKNQAVGKIIVRLDRIDAIAAP
ncbi:hypothetical protein CLU85_4275 [Acidovorax sp. 69]|uniref:hypothetical protein n=1 Tax=Acidovorax sp. 69 TaxID=2035202 RepID=UPI000C2484FE|nr:hypothetical protein [Acidovorax sp. 69]PJI99431.1 hypothetical protein CLU85_4275 [Acidovorax sp. 69]